MNRTTYLGSKTLHDNQARTAIFTAISTQCQVLTTEPKHRVIGVDVVVREYGRQFGIDVSNKDGYNAALNGIANGLNNNELFRDKLAKIYADHARHGQSFDDQKQIDLPTAWEDLQIVAKTMVGDQLFC